MDDIRDAFARQGLCRAPDDRVFGGVATGLGRRRTRAFSSFQIGRHADVRTPRRRGTVT